MRSLRLLLVDEIEKQLVDAVVVAEFGMEGGGEQVSGADEGGKAFAGGEDFDGGAGVGDARGTDEDHFERAAGEFGGGFEDGGVVLAAVGVALDGDVEGGEGGLGGVLDAVGEQDGSGTGAEGGGGFDEGAEDFEEVIVLEELEHGGGFAAGHDEAVEAGELVWSADEAWDGTEGLDSLGVGFVGTLEGEYPDGERVGFRVGGGFGVGNDVSPSSAEMDCD